MRITKRGQVTIPVELRERTGLLPGTEVEFVLDGEGVRIMRARKQSRGQRLVGGLRGRATTKMTTDEILAHTRGE